MICKSCGSKNLGSFLGEMALHFPGLNNIDTPTAWVFGEVSVCLDCGTTQFAVPELQLKMLSQGTSSGAA